MTNPNDVEPTLLTQFPGLGERWRAGEFEAPVFAALYFLIWQIARHGQSFASRKRKTDPRRPVAAECLAVLETEEGNTLRARLLDYLERYQFRGVIDNVPVALHQWLRGNWSLTLCENIPGSHEVLRMQARGTRPVTVLTAHPRLLKPVLKKPDAFAFFVHDLEHAYKFFYAPSLHAGQREFFTRLDEVLDHGVFEPYREDTGFNEQFDYLMSDMNTHPEHSRQYLRAILIEFHLRREGKALTAPLSPAAERAIEDILEAMSISAPLAVAPDVGSG
jgi:hypothetical protein